MRKATGFPRAVEVHPSRSPAREVETEPEQRGGAPEMGTDGNPRVTGVATPLIYIYLYH